MLIRYVWAGVAIAWLYFTVHAGRETVRLIEQQQSIDVSWKMYLSTHPGMHCDGT